jgi:competence protein ComEC
MKSEYTYLGLNHLFSPSGFHLSAILTPVFWLTNSKSIKLSLLILIGILLIRVPGLSALKRMVLVKTFQTKLNIKLGFFVALIIDLLFGTFQSSPISFTYSFLFLGLIYSGIKGIKLIVLFFFAQILIAYFQQNQLSLLIIFWSPILNWLFGMIMPVLMVLSFPLFNWQLQSGLFLLSKLNNLTHFAYMSIAGFPQIEVHFGMLLIMTLFLQRRWLLLIISILFLSNSLNTEKGRLSIKHRFDMIPLSDIRKMKGDKIYFKNERCRQELITGYWNIKCSPVKRST